MASSLTKLVRDESAATAIEYGLIAALVVLAAMTSLMLFGDEMVALYQYFSSEFIQAVT